MIDFEQSIWIQQRIKSMVHPCLDRGNQLHMRCFLCGDSKTNKSKKRGTYYKSTGTYFCWNCQCNLIGLNIIAKLENRPYKDIKGEYLKDRYGKDFRPSPNQRSTTPKVPILDLSKFYSELPTQMIQYLEDRKIPEAPFLSSTSEFLYDDQTKRLVIPWYTNGRATYYQGRTLDNNVAPKYLFPKAPKTVYNLDMVDPGFPFIFLLEGALDAIFVRNGVAIGGKNLTVHQKEILQKRWPKHKLVYFLDNHHQEKEMVSHILKLADKESNAMFLLWPKEFNAKDVNQWVLTGGENPFVNRNWLEKNIQSSLKVKFMLSNHK